MSLLTQTITTRSEFSSLAPEWNKLLHKSGADSVFLTFEWLSSWLNEVYPQARLFIITVRDTDNKLVAAAPFYLTGFKLFKIINYQYLRFIGDCHAGAEYPDIIVHPDFEKNGLACIQKELAKNRSWHCAWITNISGWKKSYDRLAGCFGPDLSFSRKRTISFSNIKLPVDIGDYLAGISGSHRALFFRQERKIYKNHEVSFKVCRHPADISTNLADLFHLHALRWQSLGQSGSFKRRPLMVDFYRTFAAIALTNGWLGLFSLKIDGVVQAVQYGYIYRNTFHQLQEGFNPKAPAGIGNVLRLQVIKWCIDEGIADYDFLGDHTRHKSNWGGKERPGWHLFLGRRKVKNTLLRLLKIWPTGRYIEQGKPANLGKNH